MTWLQLQNEINSITVMICEYSPNFTGELLTEWLVVFHAKTQYTPHFWPWERRKAHGEVKKTGARLTKVYDVLIQRYCNWHAKIQNSKMHMLRCMGSKFFVWNFTKYFEPFTIKYAFYEVLKTWRLMIYSTYNILSLSDTGPRTYSHKI